MRTFLAILLLLLVGCASQASAKRRFTFHRVKVDAPRPDVPSEPPPAPPAVPMSVRRVLWAYPTGEIRWLSPMPAAP